LNFQRNERMNDNDHAPVQPGANRPGLAVPALPGRLGPARRILQGNVTTGSAWQPLLDPRFARQGVFFIPAGAVPFEELDPATAWFTPEDPDRAPGDESDWRADDALFAPPTRGVGAPPPAQDIPGVA
jgi:hypothetical protein